MESEKIKQKLKLKLFGQPELQFVVVLVRRSSEGKHQNDILFRSKFLGSVGNPRGSNGV